MNIKMLLLAELPSLIVSSGLGIIFGVGIGAIPGLMLFIVVLLVLQPFVLVPLFLKRSD
jgi:hypothetical protein